MIWRVNTSNSGKLAEYKKYLGESIEVIQKDLPEPDADALSIIRYKASQFENVIVDDVSLDIEGEAVGAHIKWQLENLPEHIGKKAWFVCYLGIHRNDQVEIFRGITKGRIVSSRGEGFGFNPFFLPSGADKTLAEQMTDQVNARKKAIDQLLLGRPWKTELPLKNWDGQFQKY